MGWMGGEKPLEHQLTMFGVWLELHYAEFLMTPRSCSHLHDSEVSEDLFFSLSVRYLKAQSFEEFRIQVFISTGNDLVLS